MAEYYGTAILPARVRSPKDKATVEGTVGIISTFILAALRNLQFLFLPELNEAIWDRLEVFNHKPFQKRDGSRASSFTEERPFLRPLPPSPFELAIWKAATVGPNYHISVERMNYSVPFEYIKQKVNVRLTKATVEVFFGGNRICSHPRLYGRFNQYSTIQEHMSPDHQKYVQWNGERFIQWAGKGSNHTQTVVRAILGSYKVEQQGYKPCMGLLKLADKYTPERLENACRRALEYTPRPSLERISRRFWHLGRIGLFLNRMFLPIPPPSMGSPVELTTTEGGTSDVDRNNSIQAAGNAFKCHGQCTERPTCRSSVPEYGL